LRFLQHELGWWRWWISCICWWRKRRSTDDWEWRNSSQPARPSIGRI